MPRYSRDHHKPGEEFNVKMGYDRWVHVNTIILDIIIVLVMVGGRAKM